MAASRRANWLTRDLLLRLMLPLLVIVGATGVLGTLTAQRLTDRVFDRWLLDAAHSVAAQLRFTQGSASLELPPAAEALLLFDEKDRTYFSVTQGERLLAGRPGLPRSGRDEAVYRRGQVYLAQIDRQPVRIARVDVPAGEAPVVTVLMAETEVKRQRSAQELGLVVWPMAALLGAAALAIVFAVRRTLRPLENIATRWSQQSQASLQAIDDADVPRELLGFTAALNDLLARIREMLARERQFAATAAHQLRTPLAGLELGLARAAAAADVHQARAVIGELRQSTQRTARLVQQLLIVGRLDPEVRGELDFRLQDLAALAQDVGAALADLAVAKAIDLALLAAAAPVQVAVNPELMCEALANLIDNAIRYTPAGGRVVVEVLDQPPRLRVADSGPGIAEDEREAVFERFVRGRHAGGDGGGLGLAIVRDICQLHGIGIELDTSPWGGARVTLVFSPCAKA
ncbi:MAG: sensor histidine kinase N-terminal domain-containing protein [Rubrivivax sp.]|nr:sensor histidine kinase N-terminal domain-containing protein [Rubrivivax sp.]